MGGEGGERWRKVETPPPEKCTKNKYIKHCIILYYII
jgi:hypothetical protein